MKTLLDKTPINDLSSDVLPMLYRALDGDDPQIQELCLTILPQFSDRLDSSILRSGLLPRIRRLCSGTRLLSVRVNCLVCVGKMLEHMDKWQVIEEVIPLITQLPSREPAIVMATIGIFKISMNNPKIGLSKEVMANKVLPFLFPVCMENSLSLAQFDSVMELIKDMTRRVETEQRDRLQQMKVSQDETKITNSSTDIFHSNSSNSFSGFSTEPTESKKRNNIIISSSTSTLSLEDKQRLFRGQEEKNKDSIFAPPLQKDILNKNNNNKITSSSLTEMKPVATPMAQMTQNPSLSVMTPSNNTMPGLNMSGSKSYQTNYGLSSNYGASSCTLNTHASSMNNLGRQNLNVMGGMYSSLPVSNQQGVAPRPGFYPDGILQPSNAETQPSNNSNSTKQLSMADINDLLS